MFVVTAHLAREMAHRGIATILKDEPFLTMFDNFESHIKRLSEGQRACIGAELAEWLLKHPERFAADRIRREDVEAYYATQMGFSGR